MGLFKRKKKPVIGDADDFTPSGEPIHRNQYSRLTGAPPLDEALIAERDAHLSQWLGDEWSVLHEIVSEGIHLDVYLFTPTPERPFNVLVTSGMSDLPMTAPPGAEHFSRLELMIGLPVAWPGLSSMRYGDSLGDELSDEANYWPIRLLKDTARMPHDYETWLWWGHSVPNGHPVAAPYTAGLPFTGVVIGPPYGLPPELMRAETHVGQVAYLAVLPVTDDEMAYKISVDDGANKLIDRLGDGGVTIVVDPHRRSVV